MNLADPFFPYHLDIKYCRPRLVAFQRVGSVRPLRAGQRATFPRGVVLHAGTRWASRAVISRRCVRDATVAAVCLTVCLSSRRPDVYLCAPPWGVKTCETVTHDATAVWLRTATNRRSSLSVDSMKNRSDRRAKPGCAMPVRAHDSRTVLTANLGGGVVRVPTKRAPAFQT